MLKNCQDTEHILKFLPCEHRKIFEVCLAIFQNYARKGYANLRELIN